MAECVPSVHEVPGSIPAPSLKNNNNNNKYINLITLPPPNKTLVVIVLNNICLEERTGESKRPPSSWLSVLHPW